MNKVYLQGLIGALILLFIFFISVSLISGITFAGKQFSLYWYYILPLSAGFGVQFGLYSYLKSIISHMTPGVIATTGATSTAAMISCCAHYLINILPVLGTVGIITAISQYQIELFWVGILFNIAGILYMLNKVIKAKRHG